MSLSDRRRQHLLDDALQSLIRSTVALAAVEDGSTVMDRIRQAQAGPATQRYDTPRVGGHVTVLDEADWSMPAVSDPTGEAAVRRFEPLGATGRVHAHQAELDHLVGTLANAARRIEVIVAGYGPPRHSNEADRLALARQNGRSEPGCESCARTEVARGVPRWVPIDSRLIGATDVGGRLEHPQLLCVWCHDKVERWGRLPTPDEIDAHHSGIRVRWPDDVARPA
jgi:hypothetical protein